MKVYVDENDIKRNIITYCNGTNTQQGLYVYGKDKIEVLSLSAHDKQVRQEVCEEIKKTLFEYLKVNSMEELENLSLLDSTLTYDVITDKLDQLQGEIKCK